MAIVNKNFRVKNGLIVDGSVATVGGYDVLTEASTAFIISTVGGSADTANTPNTVVKRDGSGNFAAGTITANITGNLTGDVTGTVSSLSNHTTDVLSEGTNNLYFTNARALAATASAYDAAGAASAAQANAATDATAKVAAEATARDAAITSAISTEVTNRNAAIATAKSEAIADASADATTKADAAQAAAEATASADATTKADAAQAAAEATASADATTKADAAQAAAIASSNTYTDTAVSNLVDSAPELLDTLNELAAAIGDNPNYAADLATSVGEKVSKAGDTMTGLLVLSADPSADLGAATKQYVDTAESDAISTASSDATSKANAAQSAAISTASADATTKADAAQAAAISTAAGDATTKADAAQAAAIAHADALDTDDVAEGTAQYFTDARAKTSAASLLTGATLTNITISGNGSGLTITAENGVADSDTDDLTEGTSNLYFTDVRAVSALEAVTPDFPAVEIASIAKQVAAEASIATASTNTAVSWAKASYRSAEFLVKIANGTHTEVSKVILTLDTSDNVAITEYAMVGTNGSLGSVSADVSGDDVRLRVTTANNTSVVGVVGTLIK